MSPSFPCILRATARNRVVVAYAVSPSRAASILPNGLTPTTHDGQACASLVGVELTDVRVLGLSGPGLRRVPMVEMRVHARLSERPSDATGTWTVQAHVPQRFVAWGGRWLYGEPVRVASMQPVRRERAEHVEVTYRFDSKGREQRLRVRAEKPPAMPSADAASHAVLRPACRFGIDQKDRLLQTRIDRSAAPFHPVCEHHVTIDAPTVYGEAGRLIEGAAPAHAFLSPEEPVALHWRTRV